MTRNELIEKLEAMTLLEACDMEDMSTYELEELVAENELMIFGDL